MLADLTTLKEAGLTGGAVAINFSRRLIQPIKDRIHPAYEYWGFSDPTREVNWKVPKEEMVARVMRLFCGTIRNKTCPKAQSLLRPADLVRSCLVLHIALDDLITSFVEYVESRGTVLVPSTHVRRPRSAPEAI